MKIEVYALVSELMAVRAVEGVRRSDDEECIEIFYEGDHVRALVWLSDEPVFSVIGWEGAEMRAHIELVTLDDETRAFIRASQRPTPRTPTRTI